MSQLEVSCNQNETKSPSLPFQPNFSPDKFSDQKIKNNNIMLVVANSCVAKSIIFIINMSWENVNNYARSVT